MKPVASTTLTDVDSFKDYNLLIATFIVIHIQVPIDNNELLLFEILTFLS